MSRRLIVILAIVAGLVTVSAGVVLRLDEVDTYAIRPETFKFTSNGNQLFGIIAMPPQEDPVGVVAFIHGDGPVNADHDGGYRPIWESLANAGYASISWDKPGIGHSSGNWEHQSMDQRADEVLAAIDAAQNHLSINSPQIGLIAFSQGGWPLPLVAGQRHVDFAIAVSPAISWRQQGRYDLDTYLSGQDATPTERSTAHDYNDEQRTLIDRKASYTEYTTFVTDQRPASLERFDYFDPMSADRWQFVLINNSADATSSLPNLANIPVLLQLAGHDIHVDVEETDSVYRQMLNPDCLQTDHYPDAGHSMLKQSLEESKTKLWIQALWQPRDIFADPFLNTVEAFANEHPCSP